jgi:putative ABC transport system permease protein
MDFSENFAVALRALAANKLRSALTMLGIVIGVGAVVALMALGTGATADITSQVQGAGANLVIVVPGRMTRGDQRVQAFLYFADYDVLKKTLNNTDGIAGSFQTSGSLIYATESVNVSVIGTMPAYARVRAYEVEYGRFISETDRQTKARVVVLGAQTATDLFHGLNPLGRSIKINGVSFQVVGVLKAKGGAGGFGGSADALSLVPLETAYSDLLGANATKDGKLRLTDISISAANSDVVNELMVQAERLLRRQHKLSLKDDLDFSVFSQASILSILATITATLTSFLGFIAAIALVVGGIGVMNIMLVSVTERTREIGLRKAVGAKRMNILSQFLVETLTLTLLGGLLGIGVGWLIAFIVRALNLIKAQVTPQAILIAFVVTAVVGLLSGLYPAYRASRLNPIDALRYE